MARKEAPQVKAKGGLEKARPRSRPLAALASLVLAVLLLIALADYSPLQSPVFTTDPRDRNLVGAVGTEVSRLILLCLGVAGYLVPLLVGFVAWLFLRATTWLTWARVLALLVCLLAATGLLSMQDLVALPVDWGVPTGGGLAGRAVYDGFLRDLLGPVGSAVLLGLVYGFGLLFVFVRDIPGETERLMEAWRASRERRREEAMALEAARVAAEAEAEERAKSRPAEARAPEKPVVTETRPAAVERGKSKGAAAEPPVLPAPANAIGPDDEPPPDFAEPTAEEAAAKEKAQAAEAVRAAVAGGGRAAAPPAAVVAASEPGASTGALKIVAIEPPKKATSPAVPEKVGDYQFPPLKLLREPARNPPQADEQEHQDNAETLLRTLREFGVTVTLGEIHSGPVITRYEVFPAPGVRVEKISALDKNLALALRAQSVRILAPVPGKGCVGIEVPNQKPLPVGIREILESAPWAESKAEIPLSLGREVDGAPVIADLTRMPHLLIAGATGSGKSVCINAIVASLVYRFSPADLRLIMVDPKIVELSVYNDLPHMLIPVVTHPKKVPGALKWLIGEMERRYQAFAQAGVRNLVGYNHRRRKKAADSGAAATPELGLDLPPGPGAELPERYPYIVAIIDEIADLMMVAPAEIETGIARLAQLARAAGIHLVLATQRPSVNVITGVIKANLPCRIAFQVSSAVDSRTIIDSKGAEQLIGRGDLLFSPPGSSKLIRAQGAYLADEEVRDIVEYLKRNGPPLYADDVQAQIEASGLEDDEAEGGAEEEDAGDDDPLLPQAVEVLKATRRASTSMLQRRLRIGYNRAARLMELMEAKGWVGPENGSSPRDILVDLDSL